MLNHCQFNNVKVRGEGVKKLNKNINQKNSFHKIKDYF